MIWGLGGPEEGHQLHHCCWTGRVGEREEEEDACKPRFLDKFNKLSYYYNHIFVNG